MVEFLVRSLAVGLPKVLSNSCLEMRTLTQKTQRVIKHELEDAGDGLLYWVSLQQLRFGRLLLTSVG